MQGMHFK